VTLLTRREARRREGRGSAAHVAKSDADDIVGRPKAEKANGDAAKARSRKPT